MSILSPKTNRGARSKDKLFDYQYRPIDEVLQAQPQNIPASRVYVFGEANVTEEELLNDEADSYELRSRPRGKGKAPHDARNKDNESESQVLTIERPIQKGETLAKIAIKYCCEVAELKRINNLHTDQDFFALKSVKVPVQRHGLVREKLEEEIRNLPPQETSVKTRHDFGIRGVNGSIAKLHQSFSSQDLEGVSDNWNGLNGDYCDNDCDEHKELLVREVSIPTAHSSGGKEAENFLKQMDQDIKNILTSTSSQKRNLEEVRTSLTCRRIYPLKRRDSVLGADCGIKLGTIVTILVLVALITPLIYFLYFEYGQPREADEVVTSSAAHLHS